MKNRRSYVPALALCLITGVAAPARAEDPDTKVTVGKGGVTVQAGGGKAKVQVGGVQVDAEGAAEEAAAEDDGEEALEGEEGETLSVVGNGKKVTHACVPGKALVIEVTGDKNNLTLTGECKSVSLVGNHNTVIAEAVGAVVATGNHLVVKYRRGLDGKPPKVTKLGNKISITKLER